MALTGRVDARWRSETSAGGRAARKHRGPKEANLPIPCPPGRFVRFRACRSILMALAQLVGFVASAAATDRLVTIGGSITEIVFALGAGDQVVAVDSTSLWPPAADALPDIGYMRRLSAEPIIAQRPDLVIAAEDSGPAQVLQQLREAGLQVESVPDEASRSGIIDKISIVARLLEREPQGAALTAEVERAFAAAQKDVGSASDRPRVLFLMSAGRGAPQAAGTDTAANAIIELAGGQNAVQGYRGYRPLTPEAAITAGPEVILAMQQTVDALGGRQALLGLPEVTLTPAGRAGRLVSMDGLLLLGFGPRTPEAVANLAAAIHPRSQP